MSVCTFLASDHPLPQVRPPREYPLEINIDEGTIYDGGADDNYFLLPFLNVRSYTDKQYGVYLEWNYTKGRAEQIIQYIKENLENTDTIELWHVWLMDYYEFEERPFLHSYRASASELTAEDIKELDSVEIWNKSDRQYPERPSFYRLTITR